jgi:heptaprenyl diphosphate synthase
LSRFLSGINISPSADNRQIALLSAYAVILQACEALIPNPLPWLRFGFANIITLIALILYGFKTGMTITFVRVGIVALLRGTLLGPAFILSLGGGVVSAIAMWIGLILFKRYLSPIGISLIGAVSHNSVQLFLAYLIFIKNIQAVTLIAPALLMIGVITGALNGLIVTLVLRRFQTNPNP